MVNWIIYLSSFGVMICGAFMETESGIPEFCMFFIGLFMLMMSSTNINESFESKTYKSKTYKSKTYSKSPQPQSQYGTKSDFKFRFGPWWLVLGLELMDVYREERKNRY